MSDVPDRAIDALLSRSLKAETTPEEEQDVLAWRAESPDHEREYRELQRLAILAARINQLGDAGAPPSMAELTEADELAGATRPLRNRQRALQYSKRWWWLAGAAMAAAVIIGLGTTLWVTSSRPLLGVQEFVADQSGATTTTLRDGSVVRLAPGSRLRLVASSDREVFLEGRGYFAIAHDSSKPFRIRSSAGDVTVLGTRFDLSTDQDSLRLIVVEGRVAVVARGEQVEIGAGQTGGVLKGAVLPVVKVSDARALINWVGNFLAFQSTPLSKVAVEIEQHYAVQFQFADSSLGDRTVTGWFSGWKLDDVLKVVCTVADVRCTKRGEKVIVERL